MYNVHMNKYMYRFLPFAVLVTFLSGLILVVTHNEIRQAANNPQIEIAENAIDLIFSGVQPYTLYASRPIDIEKRLSTFQEIYNDKGDVIGSNGRLDGQNPQIPQGVLEYARTHGENRLTWEPKPGVRLATVVMRFASSTSTSTAGFVLAARNMREIENRQKDLIIEVVVGWVITLLGTGLIIYWINKKDPQRSTNTEDLV